MKSKAGIFENFRRSSYSAKLFTAALTATLALASTEASSQGAIRPPFGHPNRPMPPARGRCVFSGGRRTAEVDRMMNVDGRGTDSIDVRNRLKLGRECAGVTVDQLRVYVSSARDRRGGRVGAEVSLVLDGRRTGPAQRVIPGRQSPLIFRFPANEDQLGSETRKIEIEVRGKAFVDTIELIADRRRGGFEDDGRIEDEYTYRSIIGKRVTLGMTERVDIRPKTTTIVPSGRKDVLKGLELRALGDDFQILRLVVRFADRGEEQLVLGRRNVGENSSVYVDFEGSRFRDARTVSRIEVTGRQVDLFDEKPRLQIIGIQADEGRFPGHGRPGRGRP